MSGISKVAEYCYRKNLRKTGTGRDYDVLLLSGNIRDHDVLILSGNGQVAEYFCNLLMVAIVRNCYGLVTVAITIY